jgi:hypothetical protein
MTFRPGDYVYPADLPRRVLCRVACAETASTRTGPFQILTLEPLAKPWNELDAPLIVRLDGDVRPVAPRELWRATGAPAA